LPKKARDNAPDTMWDSIVKNYDLILGAQLSNSFIILMALNESNDPLSATEISKVIASRTNGKIFKIPATLHDSIEKRLKREGYVASSTIADKPRYSITFKGQRLLRAWIAFLEGCS
jgi:DNA-binding PadR family transcriptional regulator